MLTFAALPPEIIGSVALVAVISGALAILAWRGLGPPATGWWAVALLIDAVQALGELSAPGAKVAGIDGNFALQIAQAAAVILGAHRWFGPRLSAPLALAALALGAITYTEGLAGFAAGAAAHLGIAAWLLGRRRVGPARLAIVAGFALMGSLDALAVTEPGIGWRITWPAILSPIAVAMAAAGLAGLAFTVDRSSRTDRALHATIDGAQIGLALYDRHDRLTYANRFYFSIYGDAANRPALDDRFEDILRRLSAGGFFAGGPGQHDAMIEQRLARHRNPSGPLVESLTDGRFIQVAEHRLANGSTVGLWTDITEVKRREEALALAVGGRREAADFLEVAVKALARGLGYRWAQVGRRSGDGDCVEMVAAWDTDRMVTLPSYSLADTPCADVLAAGYCHVPDGVVERYPRDAALAKIGARAYCGAVLRDAAGQIVGHIFASNDKPDREGGDHRAFMLVMAEWTATELGRREAEAALRDSEQRVRDFAEAASEWFWEMGPDLRFTHNSARLRDATGIDPAALIGRTRAELFSDPDQGPLQAHLDDLAQHRPFRDFRYLSTPPYGPSRHVSISGKPHFDEAGRFLGYRGTGRDVTEEQRAIAEASRKSALLDAAVANMAEGISIVDRDDRLVIANDLLWRLLDFPDALRKPGTPVRDILRLAARRGDYGPHDGSERAIDELVEARIAYMWTPESHSYERAAPGGRALEVRSRRLPTGEMVSSYFDISHFKAAEAAILRAKEAAELANRAKTEFLATISHELRTPLNAIIGFSEIIRDQAFGPQASERYRGYAGDVHESGVHLLNIINDILDIAKIEAGAVSLHVTTVDIGDTITQASRLVRQRAADSELDVTIDVPADLPPIEGDQRRLKQVFLNLVTNAVKFTPRGGRVAITARREGQGVTIVVADSGIGMSEADIKVALEPFRQVESHLSRSVEGTGLGLPLARSLVSLHHGSLGLESSLGKGTQAIVRLPLRQPHQTGDTP